jgi:hypothetical protein
MAAEGENVEGMRLVERLRVERLEPRMARMGTNGGGNFGR